MTYTIELAREAEDNLECLLKADRRIFNRVISKIESLAVSPHEGKPLVGNHKGEYSLRTGMYRIVYEIDKTSRIVYILTIKHRKHVY